MKKQTIFSEKQPQPPTTHPPLASNGCTLRLKIHRHLFSMYLMFKSNVPDLKLEHFIRYCYTFMMKNVVLKKIVGMYFCRLVYGPLAVI